MPSGSQVPGGQVVMDGTGHLVIGHGGIGGGHVGDQVREHDLRAALVMLPAACAGPAWFVTAAGGGPGCWPFQAAAAGRGIVAGLGDVQLAAQPELLALDTPPGVGVIRGGDPDMAGRETVALRLLLPPLDHLPPVLGDGPGVVLHQHPAQHADGRDLAQPGRRGAAADRFQQRVPVAGIGDRQLIAPGLGGRRPPGRHRGAVAAGEIGHADPLGQPVRVRGGQRLQRGPDAFPRELEPVQRRHRSDDAGGVGALLAARLDQAVCRQAFQQRVQYHLLQPRLRDPGPELGQHRMVKPRIPGGQAQQVFPVQPHPDRISYLPAGQLLRPLQHRHQRQPRRGPARLAPHPERGSERLIIEPLAQPVPDQHRQRARRPPGPVHRPDRRRDLRIGLWPGDRTH